MPPASAPPATQPAAKGKLQSMPLRILLECVFSCFAVSALAWWWLMPGGFGAGHVRFWSNNIWPLALLALTGYALWSVMQCKPNRTAASLWAFAALALTLVAVSAVIYPDMKAIAIVGACAVAAVSLALSLLVVTRPVPRSLRISLPLAGVLLGGTITYALKAESPTTRPIDEACSWDGFPDRKSNRISRAETTSMWPDIIVTPANGDISISLGQLNLQVNALLTFESVSKSGGWSILSEGQYRRDPTLGRLGTMTSCEAEGDATCLLFGGTKDWLKIETGDDTIITSYARLTEPVFSHLNSFCQITVRGHEHLELQFSPCGSKAFEPLPVDYPVGRPAQFAYCDKEGVLHVVQARSAEKGPFTTLAEGKLPQDRPFTLTLLDDGKAVATIELDDWVSQLSTALSPTAGWQVAANSIEFQRDGDPLTAPVSIWVSLAGTSVGRGWDTVGHTAGIYRNRLVISPVQKPRKQQSDD